MTQLGCDSCQGFYFARPMPAVLPRRPDAEPSRRKQRASSAGPPPNRSRRRSEHMSGTEPSSDAADLPSAISGATVRCIRRLPTRATTTQGHQRRHPGLPAGDRYTRPIHGKWPDLSRDCPRRLCRPLRGPWDADSRACFQRPFGPRPDRQRAAGFRHSRSAHAWHDRG